MSGIAVTAEQATTVVAAGPSPLLVKQVAKLVSGIPVVGQAWRALKDAGWSANLVANRITVEGQVMAQYTSVKGSSWWNVYAVDGSSPKADE